jgi:hypothetical protein
MHTTEQRPNRPVVTTLTSAQAEIARWAAENTFTKVVDASGSAWDIHLLVEHYSNPQDEGRIWWRVTIKAETRMGAREYLLSGVASQTLDGRLLALLEKDEVPIVVRPWVLTAPNEQLLKQEFMALIPQIKSTLSGSGFHEVKRRLLGEWIKRKSSFEIEKY